MFGSYLVALSSEAIQQLSVPLSIMHLPSLPTLGNLCVSLSLLVLVSLYVPRPEWLGLRRSLLLCKDDFCDYCCLALIRWTFIYIPRHA